MKKKQSLSKILLTAMFAFAMLVSGIMFVLPQNQKTVDAESTTGMIGEYEVVLPPYATLPTLGLPIVNTITSETTVLSGACVVNSDVTIENVINCVGDVYLILLDDKTLTAEKGFILNNCSSFTVYGQTGGTGKIVAQGDTLCAGIGGYSNSTIHTISNIIINGGTIEATGGDQSAGIGGGCYGNASNITINGGTVTATGGYNGSGIGGGSQGNGTNITINGGIVTATGSYGAAGIGGGQNGTGSNITINGGIVTANGGDYAAGIGGSQFNAGNNIIINGGTITATAGRSSSTPVSAIGDGGDNINNTTGAGIFVADNLTVRAGSTENPTDIIAHENATTDIFSSLACKKYAKITKKVEIVYDLNGGVGTAPIDSSLYDIGGVITLADGSGLTVGDCYFVGWSTDLNATTGSTGSYTILDSDKLATGDVVTFYAIWWEHVEYWTLREEPLCFTIIPEVTQFDISFIAYDMTTEKDKIYSKIVIDCGNVCYDNTPVYSEWTMWGDNQYSRFLALKTSATGELLIWLTANGEKTPTYAISYEFNTTDTVTGTLPPNNIEYRAEDSVSLPTTCNLTRKGYNLLGWNTNKNATEPLTSYTAKADDAIDGTITLYAIWQENSYSSDISITVTGDIKYGTKKSDITVTVSGDGVALDDYAIINTSTYLAVSEVNTPGTYVLFIGLKTTDGKWFKANSYSEYVGEITLNNITQSSISIGSVINYGTGDGVSVTTNEGDNAYDCDMMGIWKFYMLKGYSVTYDDNVTTETITVPEDNTLYVENAPVTLAESTPTRADYKFLGWNTNKDATDAMTFTDNQFTMGASNVILYAIWQEKTTVSIDENAQEFTYGDDNISFSITGNVTTNFSVTYYASEDWATPITPTNAGKYNVKITRPTDSDYKVYSKDIENGLVINQKEVLLDWSTLSANDLVYNGQAKTLTASVSNLCGSDTCTVTANLTSGKDNVNVGTFTFTANALSNNNYKLPTNTISSEYTITQATTEITGLTLTGWVYDQTANTPSATTNFGAIIYTYSSAENGEYTEQQPTNAGTYYVKASVTGNANYTSAETKTTFEITRATYDMTNAKWNYTEAFTYDGTPKIVEVTGLPDGVTIQTYTNNAKTDAGDYIASVTLDYDTTNYNEPTLADLNWTIKAKDITLTIVDIASVTYDGNRKTTTATYTHLVGDDTLTYKLLYGDNVNVGTCEVAIFSASITNGNANNYNLITNDTGTIVIEKGNAVISVDTTPIVKTYGEVVEIPQASSNFGTVICDKTSEDLVNAGNYVITYAVAGTTNFNGDTKTVNVTINKANNEITSFVMASWTYGEVASTPQAVVSYGIPSYTYSTTQNGEYTTIQPSDTGIYFIKLKIEESENYKEASLTISFTIAKGQAVIDVDTTNIVKDYGETITIPSATTNYGTVSCDKTSDDLVHVGNYAITYTVAGTNNYNGATEIVRVIINKAQNSITNLTVANVYCGTKITPTATSQFGDITYSYKLSNSEDWETLTFENYPQKIGTYLLKAQVAGTSDYSDATANTTFEILSKDIGKAEILDEEKVFDNTKVEVIAGSLEADTVIAITKNDNTENSKTINENVKKAVTEKSEIITKFDINLKKQSGGYVENIAGNKYKVTLTLTEDLLNKTGYAVVYIDGNNVTKVNSTVTNNTIVFETEHFSTWAIVADGQSSDNNNLLIYILAGIAFLSTACCVFLLLKRRKPVYDAPNTNNITSNKTKSKK